MNRQKDFPFSLRIQAEGHDLGAVSALAVRAVVEYIAAAARELAADEASDVPAPGVETERQKEEREAACRAEMAAAVACAYCRVAGGVGDLTFVDMIRRMGSDDAGSLALLVDLPKFYIKTLADVLCPELVAAYASKVKTLGGEPSRSPEGTPDRLHAFATAGL